MEQVYLIIMVVKGELVTLHWLLVFSSTCWSSGVRKLHSFIVNQNLNNCVEINIYFLFNQQRITDAIHFK